ncbi:MAG TPA: EAL domain-containing protein [Terracidiphilus sp.]|nr:EAL domain-containing protein [Terracidiphilus sp.]
MPQVAMETENAGMAQEEARLAALTSTEILDTEPEGSFDAITRLAAEYFQADTVLLGFADESRVWIKSSWGEPVGELPRRESIFEMVLASDGPVVVPDVMRHPAWRERGLPLRRLGLASFASAPVRSQEGQILGVLTVYSSEPRRAMARDQLRMLESLADMAAGQLELRRLRKAGNRTAIRREPQQAGEERTWPRAADLRRALEQRQFVLYYQPEVDLASLRIVGLEALIRWKHPDRGMISPMDFIPVAEETGLILPIGDWGLSEVCAQIERWCRLDPNHSNLRVCVNLSARQFSREGLTDHVEALLGRSGISSSQLGLEMTESCLMSDIDTTLRVLGDLRRLGVSLLVDDFGTGYSSLNHLHSFPFDILKIDRSFVGRMVEGEQAQQIVRTIVELARVMGMDVVAEGIETPEQYKLLRKLGCRFGQGFLFARPQPAEEVEQLLRLPGCMIADPLCA